MKNKRTYRSVEVQTVEKARLLALLPATLVIVAIDVAKRKQVAALGVPQGNQQLLVRFEHPRQTPQFMELMGGLVAEGKTVQVVMEPTGTYGDILCYEAHRRGAEVYQISPKRTHDAAEVFDGVPSYHDAKDATVIARLHAQGVSRRWQPADEERREIRALVARREIHARQREVLYGELEAVLARHWPEVQEVLDFRHSHSALRLLVDYPDPRQVAQAGEAVKEMMERASRGMMSKEKLEELVAGAERTQGVPLLAQERELVRELGRELLRVKERIQQVEEQMEEKMEASPQMAKTAAFVGMMTLAVIHGYVGKPGGYSTAGALEKAMGLNLKEASSGEKSRRGLHITKRGPGIVRKYLYLATLRWVQKDPIAAAWYQRRRGYTEETKGRAVVALMRKLVRGIWHLSRGADYQAERLFDVKRLKPVPLARKGQGAEASSEVTM